MSLFAAERSLLTLRPYQREAVDAVYRHLRERDDNPCVVIPVGGGKTACLATICSDAVNLWSGRVLILAHVKELLEQAKDKLDQVAPDLHVGVYSTGLGRRDTNHPVIIAGIQSVYQKADRLGHFDLVIVDECHLIPRDGEGMYRRLITGLREQNPAVRVIGFTATPFRLSSGPICIPPPEGIVNAVCYEIGIREIIHDGYLCPLRSKAGKLKPDTDRLHVRGGEYVADEVEALMDDETLVQSACREIINHTGDRRACLIFAAGVKHGQHVAKVIEEVGGQECGFVDGQTPTLHRDRLIQRFRDGALKYLCNVNVLTTGFDAPCVDCIALLRPTMSPGLLLQMIGRGTRLHPGKSDCLILDFGGNILRHGPVDAICVRDPRTKGTGEAPAKECPSCQALIATGYATCPECGYEFPARKRAQHDAVASDDGVMSGQVTDTRYEVRRTFYTVHTKRDAPPEAPKTMRVEYEVGFHDFRSEWVCFEHPPGSYARAKAEQWWRQRSVALVPDTAEEAVALADAGALAQTLAITVRRVAGEKYDRIVDHELGPKPDAYADADADLDESTLPEYEPAEDQIPF